ncbi:hypothetical protein AVEN_141234-1 [Araneus ventricosus]|uniref:Uncharacterized protein n=1 Tax=Araneus ventricosus TaxID=182803 RepID=A0A4Y2RIP7_ARAVE|nr:hypothetical protein AVEN_141234-1 [Araneus ventricosus]
MCGWSPLLAAKPRLFEALFSSSDPISPPPPTPASGGTRSGVVDTHFEHPSLLKIPTQKSRVSRMARCKLRKAQEGLLPSLPN